MRRTQLRCAIAVLLACATFLVTASAVPAVVLTTTGQIADGSLTGLGPVLRLMRPGDIPFVGPDMQYDVPLSSILQITLDFPRIILETAVRTLIGPYSAFRGIAEVLRLDRGSSGSVDIPTASLRAIALNGSALRPVPREWTGMDFLTEPEIFGATPLIDTECAACSIAASDFDDFEPTEGGDVPIWNTITPTIPLDEGRPEIPWWLGLLGVAGLVGVFYLLSTRTGS
jgi:hypothetical protein